MKIVEVDNIESIDEGQWQELHENCPDATVFQTRQWMQAWCDEFGATASQKILAVFEGSRLVGLAPLVRRLNERSYLDAGEWEILGNDYSDYQTFLTWDGSQRVIDLLLDATNRCLPHGAPLQMRDLPQFCALSLNLTGRLQQTSSGVFSRGWVPCPSLSLRNNEAGVVRASSKRSLVRHERALSKRGDIQVQHSTSLVEVQPLMDEFFAQHIARWQDTEYPSLFLNVRNQRFYRAAAARLSPMGGLLFTTVRAGQEIVAQHFGLRSGQALLWYKPAFNVKFRALSPGEVMLKRLIEFASFENLSELDFTRGAEAFKWRFASTVAFNRHFTWYRRSPSRVQARLKQTARSIVRTLRRTEDFPVVKLGGADSSGTNADRVLLLDADERATTRIRSALSGHVDAVDSVLCGSPSVEDETVESGSAHRTCRNESSSARWQDQLQMERYGLVLPCSEPALNTLSALKPTDPIRVRAVLPSRAAIDRARDCRTSLSSSAVLVREGLVSPLTGTYAVTCLYAYGKLIWFSVRHAQARHATLWTSREVDDAAIVGFVRGILDRLQWHGMATVLVDAAEDRSLHLRNINTCTGTMLAQLSEDEVPFALGLWRIAKSESLGPQPTTRRR